MDTVVSILLMMSLMAPLQQSEDLNDCFYPSRRNQVRPAEAHSWFCVCRCVTAAEACDFSLFVIGQLSRLLSEPTHPLTTQEDVSSFLSILPR